MMLTAIRGGSAYAWLRDHAVEVVFVLLAAFWFWYVMRISSRFYFWADDLKLIQRGRSWSGMIRPYNGALALSSSLFDRISAEVGGLSYGAFLIPGALCIVAVPLSYFFTTRRQLGAAVAGVMAMPLLWYDGMNLRPAQLNHMCALVGGIVCAAALNRGRRADGVLLVALLFSLASAGAGLVILAACIVHTALVRPGLRRWFAILLPAAAYGLWLLIEGPLATTRNTLTFGAEATAVRDLFLRPFWVISFDFWPLAALLVLAFLAWGAVQLRHGLNAGANFVAWTSAMIFWPVGLIHSRGAGADASTFRYAYVSLGFALLAVVPRRPITWPRRTSLSKGAAAAMAALVVFSYGAARAADARPSLRRFSQRNAQLGERARGTMLVLQLGPSAIPDDTPLPFFGYYLPHGTAGEARALMKRFGSPFHPTAANVDSSLVELEAVQATLGPRRKTLACAPLEAPASLPATTLLESALGVPAPGHPLPTGPSRYKLWTKTTVTIDVRRFGDRWARVTVVPPGRYVYLTLPQLASDRPWLVRANGACLVN
jgi:hypothetical protein